MKLISLDDVNNLVEKYAYSVAIDLGFRSEIKHLPTIDPVEIIEEMQKDPCNKPEYYGDEWGDARECLLQELLQKFNQSSHV